MQASTWASTTSSSPLTTTEHTGHTISCPVNRSACACAPSSSSFTISFIFPIRCFRLRTTACIVFSDWSTDVTVPRDVSVRLALTADRLEVEELGLSGLVYAPKIVQSAHSSTSTNCRSGEEMLCMIVDSLESSSSACLAKRRRGMGSSQTGHGRVSAFLPGVTSSEPVVLTDGATYVVSLDVAVQRRIQPAGRVSAMLERLSSCP